MTFNNIKRITIQVEKFDGIIWLFQILFLTLQKIIIMKRISLLFVAALCLMSAQAQTIKEVADSVKNATKAGNIKSMVSTVKGAFETKVLNAEKLVGTWVYVKPAVLSTSGRILRKLAMKSFGDDMEKLLNNYFERVHVTAENTFLTIHANGTYTSSFAGEEISGLWMADNDKLRLAAKNVQVAEMTTRMEHNDTLTLVMDTSIILEEIKEHGGMKDNKTNKTLVKLSKHVKKLKSGYMLVRKKKK